MTLRKVKFYKELFISVAFPQSILCGEVKVSLKVNQYTQNIHLHECHDMIPHDGTGDMFKPNAHVTAVCVFLRCCQAVISFVSLLA